MECTDLIEWNTELGCTSIVLNGDCKLISLQCLNGVLKLVLDDERSTNIISYVGIL